MNKIAVTYTSKYGAAKQYARWIAEELDADLLESKRIHPMDLKKYDVVVYGGGIYAGSIAGIDLVKHLPYKNLVIFTTSLSGPESTDFDKLVAKAGSPYWQSRMEHFHFKGGMDISKLSFIHRLMMKAMKKMIIDRRPEEKRTQDMKNIAEAFKKPINMIDRAAIKPLIDYINSINANLK